MDDSALQQPPIVEFETERLHLSTVTMDDLDGVMPIIERYDVMQWTSQAPVTNKAQGERWLSARTLGPNVFNFAIRERDSSSPSGQRARVVGLIGSYYWPSLGYMIHPDFKGRGYATEALKTFIPKYFERVPPISEDGTGHDLIDGYVDTENPASQRILEKCGFTRCETQYGEIENAMGLRDTVIFRLPRPGRTLEDLGFSSSGKLLDDEPPEPPVQ